MGQTGKRSRTTVCTECTGKRLDLSSTIFLKVNITRKDPRQFENSKVFNFIFNVFRIDHFQSIGLVGNKLWYIETTLLKSRLWIRDKQLIIISALEGMNKKLHIKMFVDKINNSLSWDKFFSSAL